MSEGQWPDSEALRPAVDSARNLRPKAFAIATDHEADIKARWTAFDELYDAVCEAIRDKGFDPDEALASPKSRVGVISGPGAAPVTVEMAESSKRRGVALALTMAKYDWDTQALTEAAFQAEDLVPTPPDPNTGRPGLTLKDQALLNMLTNQMRSAMTEDWECFYKGDAEPAARRKHSFRRMYAVIGRGWQEHSLFARSLPAHHRQWWVIFAFMCHVPGDQWGPDDMKQLEADLLPVEEPDWNDVSLFGSPLDKAGFPQ